MRFDYIFAKAFLVLAIFFTAAFAEGKFMQILTPKQNHLQTELTLNIVLEVDKKRVDTIKIRTPLEDISIDIKSKKKTECKNIELRFGENRVDIRAYKESVLVAQEVRDVYVSSELYHQFRYPPKKYSHTYFHNQEGEKLCAKCHDMSVNEVENVAFKDITKSNCYGCHKSINKEKYAHAPSANWLCTSCHKESKEDLSKYLTKEPAYASCFECHEESKETWSSAKYRHEPLDYGRCDKCHNPHSSAYPMFIRKEVNLICLECHKDKHIGQNFACSGANEGDLCTECHTPHASNQPFFLKKRSKRAPR